MELFICLVLLVILSYHLYNDVFIRKESLLNPKLVFLILWTVIVCLYSLHLFGLYKAKIEYLILVLFGIISFLIGCNIIERNQTKVQYLFKFSKVELRRKFIVVLAIISVIYFSKNFIISLFLLAQGNSFEQIRLLAQDNTSILNQNSPMLNFIKNFIVLPSATAIEVIAIVDYYFDRMKITPLFILNIVIILLRVISDGGRTPLFNFIILMICGFYLSFYINKKKLRIDKKTKVIGLLSNVGLVLISISRSGVLLFRHVYLYFAMSPLMFGIWADEVDKLNLIGYGTASLNGFIFSCFYFIKNLFRTNYPSFISNVYNLIADTDKIWVQILSTGTHANAYVSCFWFFYFDGRFFGVILGMLAYGIFTSYLYYISTKIVNIRLLSLYFLVLQGLIFSFIRFPFSKIYYALAFIIIIIAYKNKYDNKRNKHVD